MRIFSSTILLTMKYQKRILKMMRLSKKFNMLNELEEDYTKLINSQHKE